MYIPIHHLHPQPHPHQHPIHPTQSYYPQQLPTYSFYYDPAGQLCAANNATGTHLIHNRIDNRWYPAQAVPMSPNMSSPSFAATQRGMYAPGYTGYAQQQQQQPFSPSGFSGARKHRRERSRGGWEEYMYSAAAAKAAQLSLVEEEMSVRGEQFRPQQDDGDNDDDDDDVDMFPDAAADERDRRHHHLRHRHRSRSSARKTYYPEEYRQQHDEEEGWPRHREPRDAMPGVARWLDDVGSVYSDEGAAGVPPHPARRPKVHQHGAPTPGVRHVEVRVSGGAQQQQQQQQQQQRQNPIRLNERTSSRGQSPRKLPRPTANLYEYRGEKEEAEKPEKTLHRQDSGIDMSVDLNNTTRDLSMESADLDIDMHDDDDTDDAYPVRVLPTTTATLAKESKSIGGMVQQQSIDDMHCYYVIPRAPGTTTTTTTVFVETHEPATARHARRRAASINVAPRVADSVYDAATTERGDVPPSAATRRYARPVVRNVPRAPSPPVSLPGQYHQQQQQQYYQQQQQQQQQKPRGGSGWGYVEVDARQSRYAPAAGRSYYPHTAGW